MNLQSVTLTVATALLLVACANGGNGPSLSSPTGPLTSPPTKPPASAEPRTASSEGGIDGGGGGTLPAEPITHYDVEKIIHEAKTELNLYIKHEQLYLLMPEKLAKFFNGTPNLYDVLQTVDLEVLLDKPCKDAKGLETDASVHASRPNTICLSAFRIAPKLIKERAKTEILALLVHELSHFLGSEEISEARELQKLAAFHFSNGSRGGLTAYYFIEKVSQISEVAMNRFWRIDDKWEQATDHELAGRVRDLYSKVGDIFFAEHDGLYSAVNRQEGDLLRVQWARLRVAEAYQGTKDDDSTRRDRSEFLEKVFAGADEVTYAQYCERAHCYEFNPNQFGAEKIRRPHSRAELKESLLALREHFGRIDTIMRQLRWVTRPNRPPLPVAKPSPWLGFTGEYTVDSEDCDVANHRSGTTKFQVTSPAGAKTDLRLLRYWNGGGGDYGGLTDGSQVASAGNSVFVEGGGDWAERIDSFGDLWSEHGGQQFHERSLKLEKLPDGKFKMAEKIHWRSHVHTKYTDKFATCVYMLTKSN